jgi:two-component system, LytTR family, response regulator
VGDSRPQLPISPVRTIIVEDSREDLLNLRALLGSVPEIEIVGEAQCLTEAREAAALHAPDLVFLDVELGAENGFDLLQDLAAGTKVIFATVHTGYGAQAFDVNALDYLVKPVREERLLTALAKLGLSDAGALTQVQVYRGGGPRQRLALESVAAILADRDYSIVYVGGRIYPDHRRFREWLRLLEGKRFVQLDRSTLLRPDWVHSWTPSGSGLKLCFRNSPLELELGRAAARRFEEQVEKL